MYIQVQNGQTGAVHKITSHLTRADATDPDMWFHICGNDRADQSAKLAQSCDAHDFRILIDNMQRREQEATELIFPFYVFIARQAKRMVALMAQAKSGGASTGPP